MFLEIKLSLINNNISLNNIFCYFKLIFMYLSNYLFKYYFSKTLNNYSASLLSILFLLCI